MLVASHTHPFGTAIAALLIAVLVPATVIDLRERRIPNAVTASGAVTAVVLGLLLDPAGQPTRLATAVAVVASLLALRRPRPTGLGLGDVKLAGVLGLCLGPVVVVALATAFAAGAAVAVVVALRGGVRALRTATVPFGPFLAGGAVVAFASGRPMLTAYLGLLA